MLTQLKRLALAGMLLLPFGAASLHAQGTPEGTTITNVATASFTDINNNAYSSVKDSAMVKVGFLAAPNPGGQASYTPASPSVSDTAYFTIKNSGNGIDSATVNVTGASGLTISGYVYNGTAYATLAALNAVISKVSLTSGSSLPFPLKVVYSVDNKSGGLTLALTLTQLSVRTPAVTANWVTNIIPPVSNAVTVTPDAGTIAKVVSNGAPAYTQAFVVTNTGNSGNTFSTTASLGTANATVTITGISTSSVTLAPGANTTVNVTYTVANGTFDKIVLTASGTGASDTGDMTVSVSKASLSMSKTAWTAMVAGTLIPNTTAGAIVPGTVFYYKLSVSNAASSADAKSVVITDVLPAGLTYVSSAADIPADWSISQTGAVTSATVTATLTPVITAGNSRFIWVGVKITP